jgi:hypothetical protein
MKRWKTIYRGNKLLGYAGLDDGLGPCCPFEAAEGFFEIEHLFKEEDRLFEEWAALDKRNNAKEEMELVAKIDAVMAEILAPGVRMYEKDDNIGFECIDLTIAKGRVCWR